jgi:amino acid adenylation domain-containing protein/non-ribosomal peptide synthase protein (TIGR01720 family)
LPALTEINALVTSGPYAEHREFWVNAYARIQDDFRFTQNVQSYALPSGPAPVYRFEIGGAAADFLDSVSQQGETGRFVILLAALFRVLERYSGAKDCFVDTPRLVAEPRPEFEGAIPLIAASSSGLTVREYLNQVRATVQETYAYQDFPVSDFASTMLQHRPATNILLQWEGLHGPASGTYDLTITAHRGSTLALTLEGNPNLFTLHFLEHFARHLTHVIAGFAKLDSSLDGVSLLDEAETLRLTARVALVPVIGTFLDHFAERVKAAPDSIAIATEDGMVSYAELDDQSSRLAHFLNTDYSISRGDTVGILSDRSERWVIGLLGVLKAGGVYLPLDPELPPDRLRFMIEDANVRALLLHSEHLSLLTDMWMIPMVAMDFQLAALEPAPEQTAVSVAPEDAAYIIYTSGSTGIPKGVVLSHRGLLNMAQHHVTAFGFDETDRLIQFYSASFDGSMMEVCVSLLAGARLVLARPDVVKDAQQFSAYMAKHQVTTVNALPVYLNALDWSILGSVKRIISAGDSARVEDAVRLAQGRTVHNSYGPTEATVCVTDYVVDPNAHYGSRLPVGKPIQNVHIYLLDEDRQLVPEGCLGEICIAGVALAQGYLNREELTAAGFIANPFEPGERIYRTGDMGVWLPDGNLEIAGRRDSQVKVRGYRIEIGELEAALREHKGVTDAVVLLKDDAVRGKHLAAWVTPESVDSTGLREALKNKLPDYMVPAAIRTLAKLPTTSSGKVDRRTLASIAMDTEARSGDQSMPTNAIEQTLLSIWEHLLGRDRIGIHENFFDLGGDSILILQVVSRAHQSGIKLTAKQHFEHPTIAALARLAVDIAGTHAPQESVTGPLPLTPAQHWFYAKQVKDRHHFNQSILLEVSEDFDQHTLERALNELVQHHDALHLAFTEDSGVWQQAYTDPMPHVAVTTSTHSTEDERLATATELQQNFDLSNPPLLRAHLFQASASSSAHLLLIAHHLIVDGVSWRILLEDLHTACRQIQKGAGVKLPLKSSSIGEWTRMLSDLSTTEFEGLAYWTSRQGVTATYFDGVSPGTVASARTHAMELDPQQTDVLLHHAPRTLHADIHEVLLTALLMTFRQWTGTNSLLVDMEGHGRETFSSTLDLSRTVGWFTALYPTLLQAPETATPEVILRTLQEQLRAVPHHGASYGIARYLRQEPSLQMDAIAPVLFNYMGQIDRLLPADSGWKPVLGSNGPERSAESERIHLFELEGIVLDGCFRLSWTYNQDVYSAGEIAELAQIYADRLLHVISLSAPPAPLPTGLHSENTTAFTARTTS